MQSSAAGVTTLRHFYYSTQWQVLEERIGSQSTPERQFVWGLRYLDDLVLRDRKPAATSSSSSSSSSLSSSASASLLTERLYATHDQWHVTGLLSASGTLPFWIIAAGGKFDFTAKWWAHERYQAVVDHFAGKILFAQVREAGHHHSALSGVLDFRGKTDARQLVRLVHHAQGVLCPVTSAVLGAPPEVCVLL